MARRKKKSSAVEDLMDFVALLPWWAGLALAVASYFMLHAAAATPLPTATTTAQVGQMAVGGVWRGFAFAGQFIVPFICVMGAIASAVRRRERKLLVDEVVQGDAAEALDGMGWQQFEMLVGEGFRLQGYAVTETGGGGADGGVDLVLRKGEESFLVQCKQWRAHKVSVTVVRELYGVMAARGAAGGFVVTSGRFTQEAKDFAQGRNVHLMDGPALQRLLRDARAAAKPAASAAPRATSSVHPKHAPEADGPACPSCGKPMVARVAKKGANAGGSFWGCVSYPSCKGLRSMAPLRASGG